MEIKVTDGDTLDLLFSGWSELGAKFTVKGKKPFRATIVGPESVPTRRGVRNGVRLRPLDTPNEEVVVAAHDIERITFL